MHHAHSLCSCSTYNLQSCRGCIWVGSSVCPTPKHCAYSLSIVRSLPKAELSAVELLPAALPLFKSSLLGQLSLKSGKQCLVFWPGCPSLFQFHAAGCLCLGLGLGIALARHSRIMQPITATARLVLHEFYITEVV